MCIENGRSEQEKLEDLATMTENTLKALDWGNLLILTVGWLRQVCYMTKGESSWVLLDDIKMSCS